MAARAPQQVVQESHKEVLVPPKSPVSLPRLPYSDWEGWPRLWLWMGRITAADMRLLIPEPPDAQGLGRFLRFVGVGGMDPPSRWWAACTSQFRKGLTSPLLLDKCTASHRPADTGGYSNSGVAGECHQDVEATHSPTRSSIPPHPFGIWFCPISIFHPFGGHEINLIIFMWIFKTTNNAHFSHYTVSFLTIGILYVFWILMLCSHMCYKFFFKC